MPSLTQIFRLANLFPLEKYVHQTIISSFQQTFSDIPLSLSVISWGMFPPLWNSMASWGHWASTEVAAISWMLDVWAPPTASKLKIWRIPNPSKIPFGCNEEEHAGWKPTCPHLNSVLLIHLGTGSFKTKQTRNTIQLCLQINFVKYQIKKNLLCLFCFLLFLPGCCIWAVSCLVVRTRHQAA